jgi:hypothetical protein
LELVGEAVVVEKGEEGVSKKEREEGPQAEKEKRLFDSGGVERRRRRLRRRKKSLPLPLPLPLLSLSLSLSLRLKKD